MTERVKSRTRAPERPASVPVTHEWCDKGKHWATRSDFGPKATGRGADPVNGVPGIQAYCRACKAGAEAEGIQRRAELRAQGLDVSNARENWRHGHHYLSPRTGERLVRHNLTRPNKIRMQSTELRDALIARCRIEAERAAVPFALSRKGIWIIDRCPIAKVGVLRTIDAAWGNGLAVVPIDLAQGYVDGNVLTVSAWAAHHMGIGYEARVTKPFIDKQALYRDEPWKNDETKAAQEWKASAVEGMRQWRHGPKDLFELLRAQRAAPRTPHAPDLTPGQQRIYLEWS